MTKDAKTLASDFHKELGKANTENHFYDIIRKWYADDVIQGEAGQATVQGLQAVIERESKAYQHFDFEKLPQLQKEKGPTFTIISIYAADNVTFTHHKGLAAIKGMPAPIEFEQLTEQHWDLKTGKLKKEIFWHVKK